MNSIIPRFPDFQIDKIMYFYISKFMDSQIPRFPNFHIS